MPIPLAIWAAAGLGAAGVKLYKNITSPQNIVENTIVRYSEERYKFYKKEEELLPIVEKLGREKLDAWSGYGRMFHILEQIENRPGHYSFKSHKNLHLLPYEVQKLKKIVGIVATMHQNKIDKVGTGVLTVVALQGGAANNYSRDALEEDEVRTILEEIAVTPMDSEEYGELEELAVLNAIMSFPPVLGDEAFKDKTGEGMTKEEAMSFKNELDAKSLLLADASGKVDRLLDVCKHALSIISLMKATQWQQLDYLEKTLQRKKDYNFFTLEEKDHLNYGICLGINLRELARTDIVLKTGNLSVINGAGLQSCYDRLHDLLPIENLAY